MCDKASGGLYPAVNNSDVLSYKVYIPDEETLKRVSDIYHQADKSEFDGFKSQFIEDFRDKNPNGCIRDMIETDIKSVKKSFAADDLIEYIDISSINAVSRSIKETTTHIVKSAPSRAQQCVKHGDILVSTVRPINRNLSRCLKVNSQR